VLQKWRLQRFCQPNDFLAKYFIEQSYLVPLFAEQIVSTMQLANLDTAIAGIFIMLKMVVVRF